MSNNAVDVYKARLAVSNGKDVNQDNWMVMWYNTNWAELLQPAPLFIALLSSLLVVASGEADFSLVDVTKDFKSMKLKNVKFPTSFKTCLQQMVGESYVVFESASKNMTRIQNASSQVPEKIKNVASIIASNTSPEEVELLLPLELAAIADLTNICLNAATEAEAEFRGISDLTQEILECAIFRAGTAEQQKVQNEMHLKILQEQKKQQEEMVRQAKEASELMKKSFTDTDALFKDAVEKIPSGWELMAMNLVETLTNTLTGSLNMMLGIGNTNSQYLQSGRNGGQGASSNPPSSTASGGLALDLAQLALTPLEVMVGMGKTNRPDPQSGNDGGQAANSSLPSSPALSDPGLNLAQQVLALVNGLDLLISAGPAGKPDWDNIRGAEGKSGGLFVQTSLEVIEGRLGGTKPISQELSPIISKAIGIVTAVNDAAKSPRGLALDMYKQPVKDAIANLQDVVTRCNLILQQPGNAAAGSGIPGTPSIPHSVNENSILANKAVENAKHMVNQTRANLESALKSHDKASAYLMESQREITKTIGELAELNLATAQLKEIIPILVKAVKTLTTLRAQFSQLVQFFSAVASLVNDVMKPQVTSWANKVDQAADLILGGVQLSDFYRNAIYTQMMGPLKVSVLAEKIASTYLRVSDKHILPAQREVGHMLQFQEDTSPEGRAKFLAQLAQSRKIISDRCEAASDEIRAIIEEEQKKFAGQIKLRLDNITNTVATALPAIKDPLPATITKVVDDHAEEVKRQKEEEKTGIPPYQPKIDYV